MNIKEYISSGILEDYWMGNASDQEMREIECLSAIYPEIQEALDEKGEELGYVAQYFEESPSPELKNKILSEIGEITQEEPETSSEVNENVSPLPFDDTEGSSISPSMEKPSRTNRAMWIGIAASVLLLLGTVWVFVDYTGRYQYEITELEQEKETLQDQLTSLQNEYEQTLRNVASANVRKVQLNAVSEGSGQNAIVFWDKTGQKVLLNPEGLSTPPEGKQYQLWALKDGQPIDLGVFRLDRDQPLQNMKEVPSADAFAITLEPEGGNAQPTLDQLQVLGEVKS